MKTPVPIDVSQEEVADLLERVRAGRAQPGDCDLIETAFRTLAVFGRVLAQKDLSIDKLRQVLFGASTEKTAQILADTADAGSVSGTEKDASPKKKRKGHGRNGAEKYTGAEKIEVKHKDLERGCPCPECSKGKLYPEDSAVLLRVSGSPPLRAKLFEFEKLRCNLCGEIFTASPTEDIGEKKYDESAASMIAILKYGTGLPFNRLDRLQGTLGVPLPAATQWDIICGVAGKVQPVYEELLNQAAQGEVIYNDDTTVRILELMGKRRKKIDFSGADPPEERTGIFTTGIISTAASRKIALYYSGWNHAGENLGSLLERRSSEIESPIQMCDGLITRNVPKEFKTILANCIAHSRRKFVAVSPSFPEECRFVLETLRDVYRNDALARKDQMDPRERLAYHQTESGPLMDALKEWLTEQFTAKKVEPNSILGEAISYMDNHWEALTLFLRQPGAPLDNNICERALKRAILHRRNSLFFLTQNGARVGDLFMTLIYTCELSRANPFDYLTTLQKHAQRVAEDPKNWLPWNYEATVATSLAALAAPSPAAGRASTKVTPA